MGFNGMYPLVSVYITENHHFEEGVINCFKKGQLEIRYMKLPEWIYPHMRTMVLVYLRANTPFRPHTLCIQMGRSKRVSRQYKFATPVNLDIQLGRSTRVSREYKFATPVKLDIQLGRSTRVSREYKFANPVKLYIQLKINQGI